MKTVKTLILSSVSLLVASVTFAQSATLQQGTNDLRSAQLQKAPEAPLANTRRERVSFSTAVQSDFSSSVADRFVATSQEYRTHVSAADLKKGVTLKTTGPGAVVTLSPTGSVRGAGLSPLDFTVRTQAGNELRGSDAMDQLVDQAAIKATGVPFSNGMVGFRLNRALGGGDFVVSVSKNVGATDYQLHVLDAGGSAQLSLSAESQALVGTAFEAGGTFSHAEPVTLKSASAFLLSPAGERIAAKTSLNGDAYSVVANATQPSSFAEGLWELHVTAFDSSGLQRDVKTAFAAAYPTARLNGSVEQAGTTFSLGVEAASSGRYEVSAVLYGTGKQGLVPVATSATAQWLERGSSTVELEFDAGVVKASGAGAPFTLRSVALKDQSRMALLERVANDR